MPGQQLEKPHVPERNVSLDALRVFCMFLIVLGHAIIHGQVLESLAPRSLNSYLVNVMRAFLSVHVDCFVMLSGYFLCTHTVRLKKAVSLWIQALFWSLLPYLLLCAGGVVTFRWSALAKACLPFTQRRYWFVTAYLLLYLLTPFLNAAIHSMRQRQHAAFLAAFFAVYIALQNVFFWEKFTSMEEIDPLLFVFLYVLAAYFRLYSPRRTRKCLLCVMIVLCLFAAAWKIVIPELTVKIAGRAMGADIFLTNNSVTMILAAACLFRLFEGLHISSWYVQQTVALLSQLTFGVYLIHDQPEVRELLWRQLVRPDRFAQSPFLAVILIGIAAAVFLICAALEFLRQRVFAVLSVQKLVSAAAEKAGAVGARLVRCVFRLEPDREGQ